MKKEPAIPEAAMLDELIEEITVDAYGESEQLGSFMQAFEDDIPVPCEATVIGEPVQVIKFDYDGNTRRGLTATCRRSDGSRHDVAVSELTIPPSMPGGRYLGAYRKWMGLPPFPPVIPVELVVLSIKRTTARCRVLGSGQPITFRASRLWTVFPGEIAVVKPAKQWTYSGNPYLSGVIESTRLDPTALGLVPLRLEERGLWNPAEHFWGDTGQPIEDWAKPIIARGPRPQFEMEQVLPGIEIGDPFSDPIGNSNDLRDSGDAAGAYKILMDLCHSDLRCLDAHSHLGNMEFARSPKDAIRHYEVGFRIGELSLSNAFDGVLQWGMIDNRPFLRCMHGYGLCLWRLGKFDEAAHIFDRMLWMNPSDNQGVRCVIHHVRDKKNWVPDEVWI